MNIFKGLFIPMFVFLGVFSFMEGSPMWVFSIFGIILMYIASENVEERS